MFLLALFPVLFLAQTTFGQSVKFVSDVDQSLSLKSLVCAPLVDNVSGIYATPLDAVLKTSLESSHQWDTRPLDKASIKSPEEFENSPEYVKTAVKKSGGDSLIAGRISKGPNGVNIKLTLYSGYDGLPIGSESLANYPGFEINDLKIQLQALVKSLRAKLPYRATILSRKGQLVTLNIGASAGLRPGTEATVIQIIKVQRHPKFGFLISTENVILGKLMINKVDDSLSFATITTEREASVITPGAKVSFGNEVQYPNSNVMNDGQLDTDLADRPDHQVAFGDHPKEWIPESPPSIGKIGLMLGLGNYSINNGLSTGGVTGSSSIAPSLHFNAELWFNQVWAMDVTLRDYVANVSNGLSGSTPGNLNVSLLQTALGVSYSFLLSEDFFGPKFKLGAGYSTTSTNVDNSTPTAFESTTYGGLYLKLGGSLPLGAENEKYPYSIGGRFTYFINPTQSEVPTNSGSASGVQVSSFGIFAEKRIKERVNLRGELMFDSMTSNFNGQGSRTIPSSSSSQSWTTLAFGGEFLF